MIRSGVMVARVAVDVSPVYAVPSKLFSHTRAQVHERRYGCAASTRLWEFSEISRKDFGEELYRFFPFRSTIRI